MYVHDKIRVPYYFANVKNVETGEVKTLVDVNSHPFIWMAIQGEMGYKWHLGFWKEITKEEYEVFSNFKERNLIF